MDESDYKYDVAFSMLAQDETLAQEINDLLSDRYKTFLYSERQKEIAGADGELKFKQIFAEEARLVVVLYRKGWGTTPWTRMEEEAIRGRAYEQGYDFVKFVPLDEVQTVPKYVPKVQLWINALRFGAKGAASVIEARLEELGATAHEEKPVDRAKRLQRTMEFQRRREGYQHSHEAITDANASFGEIAEALKNDLAEFKNAGVCLGLQLKLEDQAVVVVGLKSGLRICWRYNYANSLEGAFLDVEIWEGHPPMRGMMFYEDRSPIRTRRFKFDWLPTGVGGWVDCQDESSTYDAKSMAALAIHFYMDNAG